MKQGWIMIPCRSAHRLISEGMDRPLGFVELARLRLHLTMCGMCSRVERQMDFLRQAMRRIGDD